MDRGISAGAAAYAWKNDGKSGAHVARGSMLYLNVPTGKWCMLSNNNDFLPLSRR